MNSVKYLSEIEVPTYYGINMSIKKPELHISADSSPKVYDCRASELPKTIRQKSHLSLVKVDKHHLKKNACQSQN